MNDRTGRSLSDLPVLSQIWSQMIYVPQQVLLWNIDHLFPQLSLNIYIKVVSAAKKVVSDSPGLVDFAIGLVKSVLNSPDGQVKIFRRSKITEVL